MSSIQFDLKFCWWIYVINFLIFVTFFSNWFHGTIKTEFSVSKRTTKRNNNKNWIFHNFLSKKKTLFCHIQSYIIPHTIEKWANCKAMKCLYFFLFRFKFLATVIFVNDFFYNKTDYTFEIYSIRFFLYREYCLPSYFFDEDED